MKFLRKPSRVLGKKGDPRVRDELEKDQGFGKAYGYCFHDPSLLVSFDTPLFSRTQQGKKDNQRLEFLGDLLGHLVP